MSKVVHVSGKPGGLLCRSYLCITSTFAGYKRGVPYKMLTIELVERSADPDAKDSYRPPLTQAKTGGLEKLEKVLLE